MGQPTRFVITTDFSEEEAASVAGRSTVRTAALDGLFTGVKDTTDEICDNLALIQRDDGALLDEVVRIHTLGSEVLALLASTAWVVRGHWLTLTLYSLGNVVDEAGVVYLCVEPHTSGVFATDLAANKWEPISGNATAASTSFSPTTLLVSANVQAAIAELDGVARAKLTTARGKPTNFSFVPGTIFECKAPGQAKHDMDLEQHFRSTFSAQMTNPTVSDLTNGKWVDPVWGLDTNSGSLGSPYRTLKVAYQNISNGIIWLMPGVYTERFDVRFTDNNLGGITPRAILIKAFAGPGSVTFRAPGEQPSEMTWTSSGGTPTYVATPVGLETVNHIIYKEESGEEVDLHYQASAAAVNTVNAGWFQDAGTKVISVRYRGKNIEAVKDRLEIMYARGVGDLVHLGAATYIEGVDFRGDSSLQSQYNSGSRPHFYAKQCTWRYCNGGLLPQGGTCFTQNCVIERCLNSDGINYELDTAGGTGTLPQGLEIDNVQSRNGVIGARTFDSTRNKNGSSAHEGYVCRINGVYEGNYGPNVTDTNETGGSWCVGSILNDPYGEIGGGETLLGGQNGFSEGTVHLDHVQAGGRLSTHGWINNGGTLKAINCDLSGTTANLLDQAGGTSAIYNPLSP